MRWRKVGKYTTGVNTKERKKKEEEEEATTGFNKKERKKVKTGKQVYDWI